MQCPYCDNEMEKGGTTLMSARPIMVFFTAEAEKGKGFFARDTKEKLVISGEEMEAYYCDDCNMIMPMITI